MKWIPQETRITGSQQHNNRGLLVSHLYIHTICITPLQQRLYFCDYDDYDDEKTSSLPTMQEEKVIQCRGAGQSAVSNIDTRARITMSFGKSTGT